MSGNSKEFIEDIHQQIQDDLGYSQSHYQKRTVSTILAKLSSSLHVFLMKQDRLGSLKSFYLEKVPEHLFLIRKYILYALIIVVLGIGTGYLGYLINESFANSIMGDAYVNMTLDNIEKGDPLGVYKESGSFEMFLSIGSNNLRVAILFFVLGSLFALGSGLVIYYNGLILGVFSALLIENGEGYQYFLTVYQHGTLEILTMVVEGAAGLCIGMSVFSPGKLSRLNAMKTNAQSGAIVILGTFPIIVLAAFIESYLTRFTGISDVLRFIIIVLSLLFVICYFIIYPWSKYRNARPNLKIQFEQSTPSDLAFYLKKNFSSQAISRGAEQFLKNWKSIVALSILCLSSFWLLRYANLLSAWGADYLELYSDLKIGNSGLPFQLIAEFISEPLLVFSAALSGSFSVYLNGLVFLSLLFALITSSDKKTNRYVSLIYSCLIALTLTALLILAGHYSIWVMCVLIPIITILYGDWRFSKGVLFSKAFFKLVWISLAACLGIFILATVVKTACGMLLTLSQQTGIISQNPALFRELNVGFSIIIIPAFCFFIIHATKALIPLVIEKETGEKIDKRISEISSVKSSYGLEVEL